RCRRSWRGQRCRWRLRRGEWRVIERGLLKPRREGELNETGRQNAHLSHPPEVPARSRRLGVEGSASRVLWVMTYRDGGCARSRLDTTSVYARLLACQAPVAVPVDHRAAPPRIEWLDRLGPLHVVGRAAARAAHDRRQQ